MIKIQKTIKNKERLRMQEIFWEYITKLLIETNFGINKDRKVSKVIVLKCVQYYYKYWMHRNKAYYNANIQRKRVELWYINSKREVDNNDCLQIMS